MTPSSEIAEKIEKKIAEMIMGLYGPDDVIKYIAETIDEARKEARIEQIGQLEEEWNRRYDQRDEFVSRQARKEAFLKAAEIAESFTDGYAGAEIAKAIRAESENI